MALVDEIGKVASGIGTAATQFVDEFTGVATQAFAPRLDQQGNIAFGPEPTPATGQPVVIQSAPAQMSQTNVMLLVVAVGAVLILSR